MPSMARRHSSAFVAIDAAEIDRYIPIAPLRAEPWALQMRTLRSLRDAAIWAQEAGEQKANRLATGVVLFAAGLGSTLVAVVTLGVAKP